jgi:hypothetical protein
MVNLAAMRNFIWAISLLLLCSCTTKQNAPDVSHVQVNLATVRFDSLLFAIDTNQLDAGMQQAFEQYPGFTRNFVFMIGDTTTAEIKRFIRSYMPVYKDAAKVYPRFTTQQAELQQAFRYVKHYFPKYNVPDKLYTYIGPIEFTLPNSAGRAGEFLTEDNGLAIPLHFYLGADNPLYQDVVTQQLFPAFVSRRFKAEYIPVNGTRKIVDELCPYNAKNTRLVEQMVDAGKRFYLLDHFLPNTPDSIKMGYTQKQMADCYENEKVIWNLFVNNDLLFSTDPNTLRDYLSDAPNTPALGNDAPGFLGQFIGWQIVKKWMDKNSGTSMQQLVATPSKKIFEEAKYKP